MSIERFERDVQRFSNKLDLDLTIVVKKLSVDLFLRIVQKTPVDTGRARSAWNIASGKPDLTTPAEGGDAAERARKVRQFQYADPFSKVFITNNLDYIEALENGHSKQAPIGMVKVSLREVLEFIDKVLG